MKRIGILAGAFNPVTRAHVALAHAAREHVDEIVCVMPRIYPHKELHGATLEQRRQMLNRCAIHDRAEITSSGLFIDIARELRRPGAETWFICGADAAERVLGWDYGEPGAIERMLDEFSMLVAPRKSAFRPPEHLRHRIRNLAVPLGFEEISSTEVRNRIASDEAWEHLVPEAIIDLVRKIYTTEQNPRP